MKITNSFFNDAVPAHFQTTYIMPLRSVTRVGYAFAEFESARSAIRRAFSQPNWDGYGALPIGEETKKNAHGVLSILENSTCAPEIVPNPNGTLSFEWETAHGFGQLEIGRTRCSFYVKRHGGRAITYEGSAGEVGGALGAYVDVLLYPKPSQALVLRADV